MLKYIFALTLWLSMSWGWSQTFIGEVSTPEGFQYLQLEAKADSTLISFPYEFRQTFKFDIKAAAGNEFTVKARAEQRAFSFKKVESGQMELATNFTGITQSIKLVKQLDAIEKAELGRYTGNFMDKNGNRAIIYARRGNLHFMSPYAEQTVSLKPIGKDKFWSTSGEITSFSENAEKGFQTLSITNRLGQQTELKRSHDYSVQEDWVMVDNDSIYVNLFIPNLKGKKPACLLLPGGGGQPQMENFEYEARFFAAHGLVAMTFDKESVGKSKGRSFGNYTFNQKALRYRQLFDYLQSHIEVDSEKVGIHGPSEGGRLAIMMGSNLNNEVAFINATAAPLMTFVEGQLYAANHYSRNMGMSEEEIVSTLMIWKNYYSGILNEKIDTTDFATIRALRTKYDRAFLPPTSDIIPLSPKKEDLTNNSVLTDASKLDCPIFLQYGENDQRVNPTGSLRNFYQYISENSAVTAVLYKRGNHSMMTPEFQICSGYAYDKAKWLKSLRIIQ